MWDCNVELGVGDIVIYIETYSTCGDIDVDYMCTELLPRSTIALPPYYSCSDAVTESVVDSNTIYKLS